MGKNLVIVESPAKAKTISKIIGKNYVVKYSMGHIRDLPIKTLGVDISDSFKPRYVVVKGRKKIIDGLKKAAETCDAVYLAPDPDREGEAIAWHLKAILEKSVKSKKLLRVQYNEITPRAVRKAFENPGQLDLKRVDAQQARRILDRIVGYKVSPLLWRRIRRGLSAGRVQSVALRLVCEREEEIRNFVPEEYWILGAMVRKLIVPLDPFRIKLVRIDGEKAEVGSAEQAEKTKADIEGRAFRVVEITTREITKKPPPPYITSTLQQAGSSYHGFSPRRTMSIAQKLYEGINLGEEPVGLITYMRTDSFAIAQEALHACRDFIVEKFGNEYCPEKPNFYKSRASAQQAHEAIRPTDVRRTPESLAGRLDPGELKVYKLIWRRFAASQMSPAKIAQRTVKVEAVPPPDRGTTYLFQATASEVTFPGYMKVSGSDVKKKNADEEEVERLPALSEGEPLECLEWLADRKETQPPPRYREASLIRTLENNGVGRPSTYAQTVSTLHQRKYVIAEKKALVPTELGMQVNNLLVASLGDLFNIKFTASMEESLDEIERGSVEWTKMLEEFYEQFKGWMEKTKAPPADMHAVKRILAVLELVKEWAPDVKRGKRIYSDRKFCESIRKQAEKGEKAVSERQLVTLLKIAFRYKDQVPEIESVILEAGYADKFDKPEFKPPSKITLRKFELLNSVALDNRAREFVDSLHAQADGGRCLSEAQIRALNNIVLLHGGQIENFSELKANLGLDSSEVAEDSESKPLIDALACVKTWQPPVTRRGKVFNDKTFYDSLLQHFTRKGFLSVRQRAVLKRMVKRYRDQIPDYENVARECRLDKKNS